MTQSAKYYRVSRNTTSVDFWFPDEPYTEDRQELDPRQFTNGELYSGPTPRYVTVSTTGKPNPFVLGAFDMPLISENVGAILAESTLDEIQRFPVVVEPSVSGYEILNVTTVVECLDERASDIQRWQPSDGRLEKVGQYRMVLNLRVDPARIHTKEIFRIKGWEVALIVSCKIKSALDSLGNLGIVFHPVC